MDNSQELVKVKENIKMIIKQVDELCKTVNDRFDKLEDDIKENYVRRDVYDIQMTEVKKMISNPKDFWNKVLISVISTGLGALLVMVLNKMVSK